MASYNACAEKRIDELIEGVSKEKDLDIANKTLREALDILNKNFNPYDNDSAEDSLNRIESKMDIYRKIIGAYGKIIDIHDFKSEEIKLSNLERGLKNIK